MFMKIAVPGICGGGCLREGHRHEGQGVIARTL